MSQVRSLSARLLLMMAMLCGHAEAADDTAGKTFTFEGVIDSIALADHHFLIKSTSLTKPKSATIKVDDKTLITIDKMPATFADLVVGDKTWTSFTQGLALKIAVTRSTGQAPASK